MGNRNIERRVAKTLYGEFSQKWRRDKRLAGKWGQPGYRRPTFHQWFEIHLRDRDMMRDSTPVDVQEYLGHDPWDTNPPHNGDTEPVTDQRGVMTIPIMANDEE